MAGTTETPNMSKRISPETASDLTAMTKDSDHVREQVEHLGGIGITPAVLVRPAEPAEAVPAARKTFEVDLRWDVTARAVAAAARTGATYSDKQPAGPTPFRRPNTEIAI